jgi:hypothetical protein
MFTVQHNDETLYAATAAEAEKAARTFGADHDDAHDLVQRARIEPGITQVCWWTGDLRVTRTAI